MRGLLISLGLDPAAESVQMLTSGLRVVVILALAWIVLRYMERVLRKLRARMPWSVRDAESQRRSETLLQAVRYVISGAILVVAVLLVLSEFGVAIGPLLATAGVAGVALGFGAQTLIKDCLNGIFILLEDQVRQGDVIEVAGKNGTVEEVTLRYVRLRDYDGAVHFVPCGQVTTVTNRSRGYAYAVVELRMGYRSGLERVYTVLRDLAREMRSDPVYGPRILEDIEIDGIDELGTDRITVKSRFKVRSLEQWAVRREFQRRLIERFEAEKIDLTSVAPPPTANDTATVLAARRFDAGKSGGDSRKTL